MKIAQPEVIEEVNKELHEISLHSERKGEDKIFGGVVELNDDLGGNSDVEEQPEIQGGIVSGSLDQPA